MPLLYANCKAQVDKVLAKELPDCKGVCFTADYWTSRAADPYLGMTLHYINSEFKLLIGSNKPGIAGLCPWKWKQNQDDIWQHPDPNCPCSSSSPATARTSQHWLKNWITIIILLLLCLLNCWQVKHSKENHIIIVIVIRINWFYFLTKITFEFNIL